MLPATEWRTNTMAFTKAGWVGMSLDRVMTAGSVTALPSTSEKHSVQRRNNLLAMSDLIWNCQMRAKGTGSPTPQKTLSLQVIWTRGQTEVGPLKFIWYIFFIMECSLLGVQTYVCHRTQRTSQVDFKNRMSFLVKLQIAVVWAGLG